MDNNVDNDNVSKYIYNNIDKKYSLYISKTLNNNANIVIFNIVENVGSINNNLSHFKVDLYPPNGELIKQILIELYPTDVREIVFN